MTATIATYLNIFLVLLSLIVLVDLLIVFKRPVILKVHLIILVIGIIFSTVGYLLAHFNNYNILYTDGAKPIMGIAAINFFIILCDHKLKKRFILLEVISMIFAYLFLWIKHGSITEDPTLKHDIFKNQIVFFAIVGRLLFSLILLNTIYKIVKIYNKENLYFVKIKKWSLFFIGAIPLTWVSNFLTPGVGLINYNRQIFLFFSFCLVLILILYRPKFLNNFNLEITLGDSFNKSKVIEISMEEFNKLFFEEQYFLKKDASMDHLAKQLNIPFESFYNFIYTNYDFTFLDIVNKARVEYFMKIINEEKFRGFTIDALAQESGFSSRHHMYPPFKKFHGGTPSSYIKTHGLF